MDIKQLNLTLPNVSVNYNWSYSEDHRHFYMIIDNVSIALYSIIFVLGTIGNGLVIWIAGFRMKKTISAIWFLNLAIADFLCCASLPVRITVSASDFHHSEFMICSPSVILFTINMSVSVFILTAMSIDRCVSVMWPFWAKVHRTRKLVRITVAIIWSLSLIFTGVVFMLLSGDLYSNYRWCIYGPWYTFDFISPFSAIIRQIRLIILFVIPFLIISISYASIFFKLRKSKRPQRSQRPYRIITAVILCFFICWSPFYIWPQTLGYNIFYYDFWIAETIVTTLSYLNSCINPIIYVFMGQDFQNSFLRSIPIRLERALHGQPNDQYEEQEDSGSTRTTAV